MNPNQSQTEQFRNIHKDKKCFVCGAGPSIGNLDLSGIHHYPVICVNSSAILMPWLEPGEETSRFWVSTDALCLEWDYFPQKVAKFECTRLVRNAWDREKNNLKNVKLTFYKARKNNNDLKWEEEGILAGSSILSAIDLSLLMGCKKIILIGVDHTMVNGNSHFWQFLPVADRPKREGRPGNFSPCQRQQESVFKSNFRMFDILNKYSQSLGATIYNVSDITRITSFQKISFQDALTV